MKQFLLLSMLLTSSLISLAQPPPNRPARAHWSMPGLAPIETLVHQAEATRPTATVRRAGRISTYTWNRFASRWEQGTVNTYSYNNQGRINSYIGIDSVSQTPLYRRTFSYNNSTMTWTSFLHEVWQGGNWQNSYRFLDIFDAQGKETELLRQVWSNGAWKNDYQYLLTYNSQGLLAKELYQEWENNAWTVENGYEFSFTYDTAGRMLEQRLFAWNPFLGVQENTNRYMYTYQGTSTRYNSYDYQLWTNGAWLNTNRYAGFTYSTQGQPTYFETQAWDSNAWQPSKRTTYTYASSNPNYSYITERVFNGTWQNETRYLESYDANGNDLGYTFESWQNNNWTLSGGSTQEVRYNSTNDVALRLNRQFDFTNRVLINFSKSFYSNYHTIVLGTKPRCTGPQVQLYPNPTAGTATVELGATSGDVSITVLNALGQPVQQLTVRSQGGELRQPLNMTALPAGVYSVRISTAAGTTVQQLVRR